MPGGDRDECRRALRRLELEAYSGVMTALRAQGPLGGEARSLLGALRGALRIGDARHQAETRRVSNDALLSSIAERVFGPNTGLEWAREGRRQVAIVPRDAPHTAFAPIADRCAEAARRDNKNIHVESKDEPEEVQHLRPQPPIVTKDMSQEICRIEGPPRKRSRPDVPPSHRISLQKHPDLSQLYSDYAKPHSGKSYGRSPYGSNVKTKLERSDVSRSSLNKRRSLQKRNSNAKRAVRTPVTPHITKIAPKPPLDGADARTRPPRSVRHDGGAVAPSESPTAQQPSVPQEASPVAAEEVPSAAGEPETDTTTAKSLTNTNAPCRFVVKRKSDAGGGEQPRITTKQTPQKDLTGVRVLQNRQVILTTSSDAAQKILNAGGKAFANRTHNIAPKSDSPVGRQVNPNAAQMVDKMLIVPKPTNVQSGNVPRALTEGSLKSLYVSNVNSAEGDGSPVIKSEGDLTSRTPFNSGDMKLSTKTFLLNSKSGHKMVVLPAKSPKAVTVQTVPVLQMKPAPVKLVTVQGTTTQQKPSNVAVFSKSFNTGILGTPTKIISKESLNQLKSSMAMSDSMPRTLSQIQILPKGTPPPLKHVSTKGNIIVLQKSNATPKNPLALKGGGEVFPRTGETDSRILAESFSPEVPKTGSEIQLPEICGYVESRTAVDSTKSTSDTTIAFHGRTADDCNADSMDSTVDSVIESSRTEENSKSGDSCGEIKTLSDRTPSLSNFADWEIEIPDTANKLEVSKTSDINLELEMTSGSEPDEFISQDRNKDMEKDESQTYDEREDINETFAQRSSIGRASRTLLSQLQDDGSSSNDSPFVLTKDLDNSQLELLDSSQTSGSAME